MVFLSRLVCGNPGAIKGRNFLDQLRVYVRGGGGGQGLPRYGGCGGPGGSVYVIGGQRVTLKSLLKQHSKKRFIAGNGKNSRSRALLGEPGNDVEIEVPPGVIVKNDAGRVLGELNEAGERLLVARGGAGGNPANNFMGQRAFGYSVTFDLKLIADIGLVGFPNAGKSTLLSAVSRASPKIASYPFTTLQPQIGVMQFEDLRQITMADLPGLIEGAHINVGMGHSFLKHVERTKMLLFMIDVHGFQLSAKYHARTAFETILLLNKELELYDESLLNKPAVLALNKMDLPGSEDKIAEVVDKVKNIHDHLHEIDPSLHPARPVQFDDIIPISAKKKKVPTATLR